MKPNYTSLTMLCVAIATLSILNAQEETPKSLFEDKALERVVRKSVFEKRDNDKPLVETDLSGISIIQGPGAGISNLAGLEKCDSLASLDIPRNDVSDLAALKEMKRYKTC